MSHLRFKEVELAFNREPVTVDIPKEAPSEYYGKYVFNRKAMFKYLPKKTFDALTYAIDNKKPLDIAVADSVAAGLQKWAMEKGCTHYTHWFHPLTDGTAEKHDSFIEHDGKSGVIEEFSGKLLIQQEPDASSFPNGGIRNTFEARGYSAWDISSPAFIHDNTLCIPTIFISYSGESLDYKTPLLRALNSVDKAATAVAQYFDENVKHVTSNLGWEQEYFLVDEALFAARPDLIMTGRTLMGHESAKNQQLEDHYFGAIPMRVEEFMLDLEIECHKLGIPAKTRHNEVAPNKHNNWSLSTDTGVLLFKPGKTVKENLQFITFISNVMSTVYKYNGLIKASISSATNAHRLGANEAPPAIISIFMGEQISGILESLVNADKEDRLNVSGKSGLSLNMSQIPQLLLDNTDRNRTSPFAFTGNRFEFRAVGSSANCASAMIAVNSALAEQLMEFKEAVDARVAKGEAVFDAILAENKKLIKESKAIHFDGNGYSEEWKEEAKRRGLDCETSVPLIFDRYLDEKTVNMFQKVGVFTKVELEARNEVKWETYTKKVQIESRCFGDMALNHIIPVATKYQNMLLDNVYKIKSLFPHEKGEKIAAQDMTMIENMAEHMQFIKDKVQEMIEARKVANKIESQREKAIAYHDTVVPYLERIRYHIDKLELMVDDEMWPLPKYRELLFIR